LISRFTAGGVVEETKDVCADSTLPGWVSHWEPNLPRCLSCRLYFLMIPLVKKRWTNLRSFVFYTTYRGRFLPIDRDIPSVPSSEVELDPWNENDRLSRNINKKVPFCAAWNPKWAQVSFTHRRKPEIAQWKCAFMSWTLAGLEK